MAEHEQEAFREPADALNNPPEGATNKLAGPLPILVLLLVILVVVGIVGFAMFSGANP